jgi:UDP-2-acetamido-2,6-beta-L-arabino-hexul-4-ose reductase
LVGRARRARREGGGLIEAALPGECGPLGERALPILSVEPSYTKTLGEIVDLIETFVDEPQTLDVPDQRDGFAKKLYATYLSYLPEDQFSYPLTMHCDNRGSFTEILHTAERGQVSVNVSRPGIVKGQHWHHTKHEKFLVVSGEGAIRFRKMDDPDAQVITYRVSGAKLEVVRIPPGYTHNIENLGTTDMVTVMWANEVFDPQRPDTFREEV